MHWNEDTHLLEVRCIHATVCVAGVGGCSQEGTCFLLNPVSGTPQREHGMVMHRVAFGVEAKEQRDAGVGGGVGPELRSQLKRVEKPGEAGRVKASLLTAWLCSQHPWCVLDVYWDRY